MKRHTPEEVVTKLRRVEARVAEGSTVAAAIREVAVTEVTYYRWRKIYGGVDKTETRRLRELEKENARLKKLLAHPTSVGWSRRSATTSSGRLRGESSEPGAWTRRRRPRPARARRERAACVPRARRRALDAPLPERPAWARRRALDAAARGRPRAPTVRLPPRVGRASARGLSRQPQARPPALARGGPSSATEDAETPPRRGPGGRELDGPPCADPPQPCLELAGAAPGPLPL